MKHLPRRTVLSGLGVSIALPLLDAMVPSPARARSKAVGAPLRLAFVYVANGKHMADWTPRRVGTGFELSPTLAPLRAVKDDLLVLTGLAQDNAGELGDGPGDHARGLATFLTGVHPVKTHGADIRVGVSADQVAAARIGHLTRFPSLELGIDRASQAGSCDSGYSCAYSSSLSWKTPVMPAGKETDPALVFDRLFGERGGPRYDRERTSLLDFVRDELDTLESKVGPKDRIKLDQYLTGVRELEQRIARFGNRRRVQPGFGRPEGVPADNELHIRLMADLLVAAFQADLTRVATFLVTNEGSNRSYPLLDVNEGHHEISHHGKDPVKLEKLARINTFHVRQLGYLLEKLKAVPDGAATLLDHSMIVYGSGISDGDRHNHDDLPVLLAGRGGGTIKTGRHLKYPKTPLNNLFLSLLDRMDGAPEKLGDSTGRLPGLETAG